MPFLRSIIAAIVIFWTMSASGQATEEYTQLFGDIGSNITESAGRMIRLRDGNLMLCGQWHDGLPFFQKMDPAGRVIYRKPYYLAGNDGSLFDLVELPNGRIAATGGCQNCMVGDTGFALLSILTDSAGNLLQLRKHGAPAVADYGWGIDTLPGGGLVVAGQRPPFGLLYFYDGYLNLQDSAVFRMVGGIEEVAHDVVTASDGSLFVTGRTKVGVKPYVLLRKFTSTGIELWSKRFYEDIITATVRGWQVRESASGSILVCGARYYNSVRSADLFLTEFSSDTGAVLTERLFGTNAADMAYAMDLAGGNVILAGMIKQELGTGNLWRTSIYRLDSSLNLLDTTVFDRPIYRDQPTGLAFIDEAGRDFAFCGISYSSNYQQQDIYWGRHNFRGEKTILSKFPRSLQLYPRDLNTNHGLVEVRALLPDSSQPYQLARLNVMRNGQQVTSQDQALIFANDTAAIAMDYNLPAELADYDFKLSLVAGNTEFQEAVAVNVVAGDAYLLTGQSNAVSRQRDTVAAGGSPWIRTYGSANAAGFPDRWYVGQPNADMNDDGNVGQWGTTIGREIVDKQHIPVAIINGARNGAAIDYFVPVAGQPPMNHNYGRALTRAANAGLEDRIRAVMFWQGETDAFYGTSQAFYTYMLDSLRRSWVRDYPALEQIYMYQVRQGCSAGPNGIARTLGAQFDYADSVGGIPFHLLSATGLHHLSDECHYTYPDGYLLAGQQVYERMRPHLYGGPVLPNTAPPTPDSAWFPNCSRDTIRLALRHAGDTYTVDAAIGPDFVLSDTSVHVVSASISGHVLTLALDDTLPGNATVAYYGHSGAIAPALLNARGIGLLSFPPHGVVCRQENPPVIGRPPRVHILVSVRALILRTSGGTTGLDLAEAGKSVVSVRLTDMLGKAIGGELKIKNGIVDLPQLPEGIYLLLVEYDDGSVGIRKILVQD